MTEEIPETSTPRRWACALKHSALPAVLALTLEGLALGGVEATLSPVSVLVFLGLYTLLGVALYGLLLAGQRLIDPPAYDEESYSVPGFAEPVAADAEPGFAVAGFVAAIVVAGVLVWHCRELTYRPGSLFGVAFAALVVAVPLYLLSRWDARGRLRSALITVVAALALLAVAIVAVFSSGSGVPRWHLLRHHKLLGTPAYYLLAPSIVEVEEALFDAHRGEPLSEDLAAQDLPADELPITERPHVIFILLDTLRADALELGGGQRDDMPRLNAFLDDAWRFTDVAANSSWTRPSVASMLTGLLPEEHGARDTADPLAPEHRTLAEVLAGEGYETAALVANVGAVGRSAGFAQGFDVFHELEGEPYARAGRVGRAVERLLDDRDRDRIADDQVADDRIADDRIADDRPPLSLPAFPRSSRALPCRSCPGGEDPRRIRSRLPQRARLPRRPTDAGDRAARAKAPRAEGFPGDVGPR